MRAGVLLLGLVLAACPSAGTKQEGGGSQGSQDEPASPARPALPQSEAEFLDLLAPVPTESGAVRIRYSMTGPGGLAGELTVVQKAGGWRREDWSVSSSEAGTKTSGTTLITPDLIWVNSDDLPGKIRDNYLRGLAIAWLKLDPQSRDKAAESLLAWRAELEKSREEHPGDVEVIHGVQCLRMRIAAQNLCMWEETGLLLRYQGGAFELAVLAVELAPAIDDATFELPALAQLAERIPPEPSDPDGQIAALVRGDFAPVAGVLAPGLRVPGFVDADGPEEAEPPPEQPPPEQPPPAQPPPN